MWAYWIGSFVGGCLAIALVGAIVGRLAFKNEPPTARAGKTTLVAWLIIAILAGFGFADGGPFVWAAGLIYIPSAIVIFILERRRLAKAWEDSEAEVFD